MIAQLATFVMALSAAPAEPASPEAGAAPAPRSAEIVCKDVGRAGSRLQKKQVCMKEGTWRKVSNNQRDLTQRMQDSGRSTIDSSPQ